jgi:hypothetical protein
MEKNINKMSYNQLLTAELFNYSYDHYADHLEVGNARFTEIMPNFCSTLGKAISEGWTHEKIAHKLEIDVDEVQEWKKSYVDAEEIVSAINPSESFRKSLQKVLVNAADEGLDSNERIEDIVIQICYRVADLGYLLKLENSELADYTDWLRREKDVDYSGIGLPNL